MPLAVVSIDREPLSSDSTASSKTRKSLQRSAGVSKPDTSAINAFLHWLAGLPQSRQLHQMIHNTAAQRLCAVSESVVETDSLEPRTPEPGVLGGRGNTYLVQIPTITGLGAIAGAGAGRACGWSP
eukprot:3410487-Pleurochrysis_carterae.AAC.1